MTTQTRSRARERARGQVLVIFVGGFLALIAGTAFVVDGGNVMAQQRGTQNGVDAASQAGATVIMQYLMGAARQPVRSAHARQLQRTRGTSKSARPSTERLQTTKWPSRARSTSTSRVTPSPIARPRGSSGPGRCRRGHRECTRSRLENSTPTSLERSASGSSRRRRRRQPSPMLWRHCVCRAAHAGSSRSPCHTRLRTATTTGCCTPGSGDWPFLGDDDTIPANEAIVPLCKDKNDDIGGGSAGSVGWLDYSTAIGGTTDRHMREQLQGRHRESVHHLAAVLDVGQDVHRRRRKGRSCDPGRAQRLPR